MPLTRNGIGCYRLAALCALLKLVHCLCYYYFSIIDHMQLLNVFVFDYIEVKKRLRNFYVVVGCIHRSFISGKTTATA